MNCITITNKYLPLKMLNEVMTSSCPFCNGKKSVSVTEEGYECSSCGSKGDAIDFVMNYEECDRHEACKILNNTKGENK